MNDKPLTDNWHYDKDPYGVIPIGTLIDNGHTKVIGFCSPSGLTADRLMVNVEYSNGQFTTRDYANVLVQRVKELSIKLGAGLEALKKTNDIMNELKSVVKHERGICSCVDRADERQDANVKLIAELEGLNNEN